MPTIQQLNELPDDELVRQLAALLAGSRHTEADLVAHIGEVDARRLYAREATPSMFAYCLERLHLSEHEAYLRIAAGRASREHPVILVMLADGRLHLTAIALLAPHLTPENRDALLKRATHKTKREVEELLAELAPRHDVPPSIRKLPLGRRVNPNSATERADSAVALRPEQVDSSLLGGPDVSECYAETTAGVSASPLAAGPASPPPAPGTEPRSPVSAPAMEPAWTSAARAGRSRPDLSLRWAAGHEDRRARVEPLSPDRYRVQFTASAELRDKLERLKDLMRSSVPDGDLAAIIEAAVTEKIERLEARRFGRTKSPRRDLSHVDTTPKTRHVPAAVRRAVQERDEGRCRYVDVEGRRCTARLVQFHHRHPFGFGGDHSVDNVGLLCSAHNQQLARVDFGPMAMTRHRRGNA
jgi:5-methylcytosine-specific restriction endonuclease McrA